MGLVWDVTDQRPIFISGDGQSFVVNHRTLAKTIRIGLIMMFTLKLREHCGQELLKNDAPLKKQFKTAVTAYSRHPSRRRIWCQFMSLQFMSTR